MSGCAVTRPIVRAISRSVEENRLASKSDRPRLVFCGTLVAQEEVSYEHAY